MRRFVIWVVAVITTKKADNNASTIAVNRLNDTLLVHTSAKVLNNFKNLFKKIFKKADKVTIKKADNNASTIAVNRLNDTLLVDTSPKLIRLLFLLDNPLSGCQLLGQEIIEGFESELSEEGFSYKIIGMSARAVLLMEHSQITTTEDMNESVVSLDDIVELEKESDELSEDGQCEIMNQDKDGDCMQDNCQEIMGDDSEFNEPPILGRVFETAEEAYDFYNDFAKVKGFGIRKRYFNRSRRTQQPCLWNYVCSKQGVKNLNDKRIDVSNVKRRRDTRTDCSAMFQIKLVNGLWKVEKFNDSHNHPLINTPSKVTKFSSHNDLRRSDFTKSIVSKLYGEGLTSSKISKVVNAMNKEVNITLDQISTIISSQRKNNVGRECQGIIKHFQKKSAHDGCFYFDMQLAEDGTLRSVFWADGRSRASYGQFGEVLVFDVTYKTNKFKFPFAPFVGVNHHGQSILFAAALLEDETEATFTWLFEQFRICMFEKSPVAIITDQDKAMGKAIAKIFPRARHRFCAWHIKKHILEHSQALRAQFKDSFDVDFHAWYKSRSIDEFEDKWEALRTKYDIKASSWLANMYASRNHWAKAYLKDTFFVGMTTSGRSESINAFFDGYVNSNTMLNDFVTQYDKAIKSRKDAEEDEDFKTRNTKANLESNHPIEAIAGERYTRKLFEIFKKEWRAATQDYFHEKMSTDEHNIRYRVGSPKVNKELWAIVDYNLIESSTTHCSCAKFETMWILCKHILYIFKKKQMMTLPEKYILTRWTMNASYKAENILSVHSETTTSEVSELSLLSTQSKCNLAISEAKDCFHEIRRFDAIVDEFIQQQLERKRKRIDEETLSSTVPSQSGFIPSQVSLNYVRDPTQAVKTKGRPKVASRIKSSIELAAKQQKTCSYCREKGHNKTSCKKQMMDVAREKQKE
ncbi:protein FAR1-RELATED SEQUENCE 5-like [Gastrolobium bilobum]|uniref:protein FAR1-RELATED SEQUENCE 5-like n=1 Tax=Gastrolobium bilobum TaxID=150636 RepID=UPI002AAF273F|nr:protein FAR1-RELATED SEQUENCE 5-like [Gastrolobium bilobum]